MDGIPPEDLSRHRQGLLILPYKKSRISNEPGNLIPMLAAQKTAVPPPLPVSPALGILANLNIPNTVASNTSNIASANVTFISKPSQIYMPLAMPRPVGISQSIPQSANIIHPPPMIASIPISNLAFPNPHSHSHLHPPPMIPGSGMGGIIHHHPNMIPSNIPPSHPHSFKPLLNSSMHIPLPPPPQSISHQSFQSPLGHVEAPPRPPIRSNYPNELEGRMNMRSVESNNLIPLPSLSNTQSSIPSLILANEANGEMIRGGGPIIIPSTFDEDLGRIVPTMIIHVADLTRSSEEYRVMFYKRKN